MTLTLKVEGYSRDQGTLPVRSINRKKLNNVRIYQSVRTEPSYLHASLPTRPASDSEIER